MGADRIMFSVDYPYESFESACNWVPLLSLFLHNSKLTMSTVEGMRATAQQDRLQQNQPRQRDQAAQAREHRQGLRAHCRISVSRVLVH